jgi:hypothetical protein
MRNFDNSFVWQVAEMVAVSPHFHGQLATCGDRAVHPGYNRRNGYVVTGYWDLRLLSLCRLVGEWSLAVKRFWALSIIFTSVLF